ncbi:thiamine phosphate synthase [Alteribacillus bidgolensis]|uniref:Thiazole tautomerase (Transcriptional regulator TenI) n=1 Tax=Alteribacillus bidgolensis TaxID=930129 RepID=A0A1G8ILW7_9BACI|nr:thiamine phosphate synthase [Alteribacillus bidgolensis]SDI19781.1 thiazole tautomerase (transcriptional regulator TenI) [Alteribacillus bidgolensis]
MKPFLHVISTGNQSLERWLDITANVHSYVDFIHIREKLWDEKKMDAAILGLLNAEVPPHKIILNNRPELIASYGLGGVHFPENVPIHKTVEDKWLTGCSIHSKESAVKKEMDGADYLFFGHVFETNSKQNTLPRGLKSLQQVVSSVKCPVIAIGGITSERVKDCVSHGAKGIAVMSGIYGAAQPIEKAKAYQKALKEEALHE